MAKVLQIVDIPGWPICPTCGSRFRQLFNDDYEQCPDCRDDEPTYGERLALGFEMMNPKDEQGIE